MDLNVGKEFAALRRMTVGELRGRCVPCGCAMSLTKTLAATMMWGKT